tara:strand:+ start:213 stop:647 length:435 start_codon:yes stop_codon:yes gene_type:complete
MAIIYSYPNVTPLGEDFLIGSQKSSSNATKNFTVDSVVSAGLGYTAYAALISQSGTNAPTATALKNNTGYTYTWARTGSGTYTITANGNAFTNNKTIVFMNLGEYAGGGVPRSVWTRTSDTVLTITTGGDGRITNGSFEIRIYS